MGWHETKAFLLWVQAFSAWLYKGLVANGRKSPEEQSDSSYKASDAYL